MKRKLHFTLGIMDDHAPLNDIRAKDWTTYSVPTDLPEGCTLNTMIRDKNCRLIDGKVVWPTTYTRPVIVDKPSRLEKLEDALIAKGVITADDIRELL